MGKWLDRVRIVILVVTLSTSLFSVIFVSPVFTVHDMSFRNTIRRFFYLYSFATRGVLEIQYCSGITIHTFYSKRKRQDNPYSARASALKADKEKQKEAGRVREELDKFRVHMEANGYTTLELQKRKEQTQNEMGDNRTKYQKRKRKPNMSTTRASIPPSPTFPTSHQLHGLLLTSSSISLHPSNPASTGFCSSS